MLATKLNIATTRTMTMAESSPAERVSLGGPTVGIVPWVGVEEEEGGGTSTHRYSHIITCTRTSIGGKGGWGYVYVQKTLAQLCTQKTCVCEAAKCGGNIYSVSNITFLNIVHYNPVSFF